MASGRSTRRSSAASSTVSATGKTKRPKANKTKVTYNKLEAGTTYNVWVRAQNESGKGERVHATITLPASQPEETAGPPGQ